MFRGIYEEEKADTEKTYSEKQLINNLLDVLYKRIDKKLKGDKDAQKVIVHKAGQDYVFQSSNAAEQFKMRAGYLLDTDHAEVFLEEPEINLFPPTQFQLMNWIENMARDKRHRNFFFIATHSPYVLSHLLQENLTSFSLFLTYPVNDGFFSVKTASEEEIQQIYDNGSDAFFNFESLTDQ